MSPRRARVLQTDVPSRDRFAAWLRAVKEGRYSIQFEHGGSDDHYFEGAPFAKSLTQAKLSGYIRVSDRFLRDMLSGAKGPSVDQAWLIGEDVGAIPLPDGAGRRWCAGILAVAAVPIYRLHVLRWIGALLRENRPTKDMGHLWPLLTSLAVDPDAAARPLPDLTWTGAHRDLARIAWRKRGDAYSSIDDRTPWVIRAAIIFEESVVGEKSDTAKIDVALATADSNFRHAMEVWFDGLARNWKSVVTF